MTKIVLRTLVWNTRNVTHIKKHTVTKKEVENAIQHIIAHRRGYKQRIILIGRSEKRLLSIVVSKEKEGRYYIVTARDADKKERSLVYEKESCT